MQTQERNRHWPCGFSDGQAVVHQGKNAHVVAVPIGAAPNGEVPIMYDDEGGCFVTVPADDLFWR